MPNGGSDCCGTCWFNRTNQGERGTQHRDESVPPYCEIRDLAIDDPFWNLDLPPGTSPLSKLDLGPFEVHSMV